MAPALHASPFSKLHLSADDCALLESKTARLVDDAQALYESFLWDDHSAIDEAQWTLVKSKENVHVYHDARPGAGTKNRHMHTLLTVGTVVGTLNDALYGVLNHTTDAMRVKTAYVHDTLVDSAVLETIAAPTEDAPFQSMSVRWCVKGVPLHLRLLLKSVDNVYLEATGMKRLRNGEDVGFHLMHSLDMPQTPKIAGYDRFKTSTCTLWRQQSPMRVEAFQTTYMEIHESVLVPMVLPATADALVSLWRVVECARSKKLAFFVRHSAQYQNAYGTRRRSGARSCDGCSVCGTPSRSVHRGAKSTCAVCAKAACDKCRVKRELACCTSDGKLVQTKLRFCLTCLTVTNRLDAATIAAAELSTTGSSTSTSQSVSWSHIRDSMCSAPSPVPSTGSERDSVTTTTTLQLLPEHVVHARVGKMARKSPYTKSV